MAHHPSDRRWDARTMRWEHPHHRDSISVIEKPAEEGAEKKKPTVPFGFARAVPRVEHDPLLFEGEGA